MTEDDDLGGGMATAPWSVMHLAYRHFRDVGEWPGVHQLHQRIAEWAQCPAEVAQFDTDHARATGWVYALPSAVAMELGEARESWPDDRPDWDNGFRIAVREEFFHGPLGSHLCEEVYMLNKFMRCYAETLERYAS